MFTTLGSRSRRRRKGWVALTAAAITLTSLTACSPSSSDSDRTTASSSAVEDGAFPVTVEHAFGETTFEREPVRILTLDSAATDTVVALGMTPTSMQRDGWAGDDDGFLPWTRAELERTGKTLPTPASYYSDSGELLFEQILGAAPDVILAPYSGFSRTDYERLSTIAPTLPYADRPYQPTWQNLTTDVGKALGRGAAAEKLVKTTENTLAQQKSEHPEFAGVRFVFGSYIRDGETETAIYGPADPRVQLVENLGLTIAPDVVTGSKNSAGDSFLFGISMENLDTIDTDVYLGWASEQSEVDSTVNNTLFARWPVIAAGKDLWITDNRLTAATMYVSVLSIEWAVDQLVPQLSALVEK
ncbi:iron complex transport system substrate-binding protein [Rhodococcus sp. 27YEA15]|uniref:ABC transporter substrate-binding protein n=1 Tax=Rhodococcus sp. 27YEA15 TaxID=3156259 RepID=UPI003C7DF03F